VALLRKWTDRVIPIIPSQQLCLQGYNDITANSILTSESEAPGPIASSSKSSSSEDSENS